MMGLEPGFGRALRTSGGNPKRLRYSLFLGTALAAWAMQSEEALAQCAPDPVVDGDDVVCSGTDTDGIIIAGNDVSLTVEAGATVTSPGFGVLLNGTGNSFANFGLIEGGTASTFGAAVGLYGLPDGNATGFNEGTIRSQNWSAAVELSRGVTSFENRGGGVIAGEGIGPAVNLLSGFNGEFVNQGTVTAANRNAISSRTDSVTADSPRPTIINAATGLIESENDTAIRNLFGGGLTIENSGTIRGAQGIELIDDGSIVINHVGGLIEGMSAWALSATTVFFNTREIVNHGTLRGVGDAITGGRYSLVNTGEIYGDVSQTSFNGTEQAKNSGSIFGDVDLGTGNDVLENSGTINGNVLLGGGDDLFRDFGGSISGLVALGDGDDIVLVRAGTPRASIAGGISAGAGLDSFGVSIEGTETVSLAAMAGFEGLALESRFEASEATLAASSSISQTLAVLGDGVIINEGDIVVSTGDAVRAYADIAYGPDPLVGAFGGGVRFLNRGTLRSSGGGFGFISMETANTPFAYAWGAEELTNEGLIEGNVALGSGDDTLINTGRIVGDVSTSVVNEFFFAGDDDFLYNTGEIVGDVRLGGGADMMVNGGVVTGTVNLGLGDDTFLIDLDAGGVASTGLIDAGVGLDVFGIRTSTEREVVLGTQSGFEGVGVWADGPDARVTILETPSGDFLPFLRVHGDGEIINNADIGVLDTNIFFGQPAIVLMDDGATLTNNGTLQGRTGLRMSGEGQTATLNADMTRDRLSGDSTGNTGFVQDSGVGNLLINNADLSVTAFSTSAVFIGEGTFSRFGENEDVEAAPTTRFINNGTINSQSTHGVRLNTNYAVEIDNYGTIDEIGLNRSDGGITIRNHETGVIDDVIVNGFSSNNSYEGAVTIENAGQIGVAPDRVINFRSPTGGTFDSRQFVDTVVNSGLITGRLLLNIGNDRFVMREGGEVDGSVDGGDDFDTLAFEGVWQDLNIAQFENFERLEIATPDVFVLDEELGLPDTFEELLVAAGVVRIDTDVAMDVFVAGGGVFGGNGAVNGDLWVDGGLSPGASVGSLLITGDLNLGAMSATLIETDSTGTDQIIVGGDALLDGALIYQTTLLPTRQQTVDFLQVIGTTTGNFSSVTIGAPGGFTGLTELVERASGGLAIQLTPQLAIDPQLSAAGVSIAGTLNALVANGQASASTDAILAGLFSLSAAGSDLEFAIQQVGPTTYAAAPWIGARQALAVTDAARSRLVGSGPMEPGVTAWLTGGDVAAGAKARTSVGAAGFDLSLTPILGGIELAGERMMAGVFAGSISGEQTLRFGHGVTDIDSGVGGVYAGLDMGMLQAGASAAYITGGTTSRRSMAIVGQSAAADFDVDVVTAQAEASLGLEVGGLDLTPLIGVSYAHADRAAATETGPIALLDVAGSNEDFLVVDAGAEASWAFELGGGPVLRPSAWLGWRYELAGASPTALASLTDTPQALLKAWSANPERSRLSARLGLEADFTDKITAHLRYDGEFGEADNHTTIHAGLAVRF